MKWWPVTAILLYGVVQSSHGAEEALAATLWKRQCGLAQTLRSATGRAASNLQTEIENVLKFNEAKLKLQIYVTSQPQSQHSKAAAVLAIAAAAASGQAQADLKSKATTSLKADGYGQAGAAYVSGLIELLASNDNADMAFCLAASSGSNSGSSERAAAGCKETADADFTPNANDLNPKVNENGFVGLTAINSNGAKGTASKCGLLKGAASGHNTAGFDSNNGMTKLNFGNRIIGLAGDNDPTAPDLTNLKGRTTDATLGFWSRAHSAVRAAIKQAAHPYPEVGPQLLAKLAADNNVDEAIKIALSGRNNSLPQDLKGNLDDVKTTMFGAEQNKAETIWNAVKGISVVQLHSSGEKTRTLGSVSVIDELEQILGYYSATMQQRQIETAAKLKQLENELEDQKGKSPEADCNKISEEPKCNEEKICSWHKEVKTGENNCKFNSTKAKEKGVSVTQTQTGGTETTTDKCKGEEQKECKSPDCKWEGETCKDSSILANKQFAVSMVSAFVVFLSF
uniref:Variant surface glycoprotein 427 n=1 Tax=Trypanosoma brucei TaxID=5691 RepID=M4T017_9TRYP|nr:variant surface glycoprotein 427 [Trypanosoma brucei]